MKKVTRENDIALLGLSTRSENCLRRTNIRTIGELLDYPEEQFLSIRNLGKLSLAEILTLRAEIEGGSSRFRLVEPGELPDEDSMAPQEGESVAPQEWGSAAPTLLYDVPVSQLRLSARAVNALNRQGWTMASQLVGKSMADLLEIKNMGRKTAEEILDKLAAMTLSVSGSAAAFDTEQSARFSALVPQLAEVFGGAEGTWLQALMEAQREEPDAGRERLLYLLHQNSAVRRAQKKAICDFLESRGDQSTVGEIEAYMGTRLADSELAEALLVELDREVRISRDGQHVFRRYPTAMEYAATLSDEHQRRILQARLSGKTLEETGTALAITRERVRQLQTKALGGRPKLYEDRYLPVFSRYFFSREDFRIAFDEPDETYNYLEIASGRKQVQTQPIAAALEDNTIPVSMRRRIERAVYKQYVTLDGVRILKKRQSLVHYVIRRYCQDALSYDDFALLYQMLLEDLGLGDDKSLLLESRTYENHMNTSRNVLWKPGRKLRYYNMDERDFSDLIDTLDFGRYTDAALSTLLFFRQYPELMREYDIRDEYELHNLLKTIWGDREPAITFSRNPIILIGNGNHEDQAMELLLQFAPIGLQELAEKYEETYGMRAESAAANVLATLGDYYHDGLFSVDAPIPPPEQFSALQQRLTQDFYPLAEVRRLYGKWFPEAGQENINPHSMKLLGFHVYAGYLISKRYQNATEYFTKLLTENDITDLDGFPHELQTTGGFLSVLSSLRQSRELIEFEPRRLIHSRRLEAGGITKEILDDYCRSVYQWIGPERFFTIRSLRAGGFAYDLDDLGFEDWFYSSLLCEDVRFSSRRLGGTRLLFSGSGTVSLEDLLIEILLEREKIDIYDLLELLDEEYGIRMDVYKLTEIVREGSLYYDSIMETVYIDYDTYFEEI